MKLIILDRDGVINFGSAQFIKSPEEWKPIPGSLEAIARLTREGWRVVVATNQSGLARGLFEMATLNAIHAKMHKAVAQAGGRIEAVFYCPHSADMECSCRKPKPGLFDEIAARYGRDLQDVPAIGDSLRDLLAAASVGARPLLVRTGKGEKTLTAGNLPENTPVFADLSEAVDHLLKAAA
ncbi:MAG: D-glycero-beta-D-manno-heptose-1,7-bisphosphate 7-phosphatase [Thiobacillus sp. SCN 63-374]|nr:MAG: D-glycero-beta-D-manno-heptose-1,7-bisphosphate 7-phosphatase [Thiobacillus sp. SCN 63-374]